MSKEIAPHVKAAMNFFALKLAPTAFGLERKATTAKFKLATNPKTL